MHFRINNVDFIFSNEGTLDINGKTVEAADKVTRAIRYFLQSQNHVITKESLMQELWEELIVSDDSIFKIIQEARKILKQYLPDDEGIVNVYGKGYKISSQVALVNEPELRTDKVRQRRKLPYILIFSTITIIVLIYLNYKPKQEQIFTNRVFNRYLNQIILSPLETLSGLSKIDSESLDNHDLSALLYLKGYAYYSQGQYKQSIQNLQNSCSFAEESIHTPAVAKACALLALINLYRSDSKETLRNIEIARKLYHELNDTEGMNEIENLYGKYLLMIHDYQKAIESSQQFLKHAIKNNNKMNQILAHINLQEAYSQLSNNEQRVKHLNMALNLALEIGNGKYISISYGLLAVESMTQGEYTKAMNWANKTLKYAVNQNNTNNFQQGFSYMYNILSPLGHDKLAEKYLQAAIDIQAKFNSDGHIVLAEINLGVLKIKLRKYQQAKAIFEDLLTYNLSEVEKLETKAWQALNFYFLKDNISAYTLGKEIFLTPTNNPKISLISGLALVFSAIELERQPEAQEVFAKLKSINNDHWLIENQFFINAGVFLYRETQLPEYKHYINEQQKYAAKLAKIRESTPPDFHILKDLDIYIASILNG